MNHDETNFDPATPPLDAELEARVVAWVAGELPPAEITELEQLAARNPAVAIFKRRMEAVQGLIAEAERADSEPLRLSLERRAQLLRTLGGAETVPAARENVVALPRQPARWSWRSAQLYYAMSGVAAAVLVGLFVREGVELKPMRPDPVAAPSVAVTREVSAKSGVTTQVVGTTLNITAPDKAILAFDAAPKSEGASIQYRTESLVSTPAPPAARAPSGGGGFALGNSDASTPRPSRPAVSVVYEEARLNIDQLIAVRKQESEKAEQKLQPVVEKNSLMALDSAKDVVNPALKEANLEALRAALVLRDADARRNQAPGSAQVEAEYQAARRTNDQKQDALKKRETESSALSPATVEYATLERSLPLQGAQATMQGPAKEASLVAPAQPPDAEIKAAAGLITRADDVGAVGRLAITYTEGGTDRLKTKLVQGGAGGGGLDHSNVANVAIGSDAKAKAAMTPALNGTAQAEEFLKRSNLLTDESRWLGAVSFRGNDASYKGGATGFTFGGNANRVVLGTESVTGGIVVPSLTMAASGQADGFFANSTAVAGGAAPLASRFMPGNGTLTVGASGSNVAFADTPGGITLKEIVAAGTLTIGGARRRGEATSGMGGGLAFGPSATGSYGFAPGVTSQPLGDGLPLGGKTLSAREIYDLGSTGIVRSVELGDHATLGAASGAGMGGRGGGVPAPATPAEGAAQSAFFGPNGSLTFAGTSTTNVVKSDASTDKPAIAGLMGAALAPAAPPPPAKEQDKPRPASPARPLPQVAEVVTAASPVSTFSLHVADVSFRLAQAALARGERPDPARIRAEEFYNAFDYGDPAPSAAEKIGARVEQAGHPFLPQRNLVRVTLRVASDGRGATPLHLTVLLDTSGSMEREDRAAAVRRALEVLVSLLGPNDRITLIGFARSPRLLAENLAGNQARSLLDIVGRTPAEGGTNLEEAIKLGGELARRHYSASAQNRVVLLTDGAANLGDADPARLGTQVETLRQQGLAFDACGVGLDGLDDEVLEALTRRGDGRYYALNSPADADAGFAQKLAGAFRPAAENVKVQVRFNAARVSHYRLIGFEQHRLQEQDFRNDAVNAAELAADENAVALYQVELVPGGEGEIGELFVRFRDPATAQMVERAWTLPYDAAAPAFDRATPTLQLAAAAALLAEKFRGGVGETIKLGELAQVAAALRGRYAQDARVQEFVTMIAQARRLYGDAP